jgi:hypothetical protein
MAEKSWEDVVDRGNPAKKPKWQIRPDLASPPPEFQLIRSGAEQLPYFEGQSYCQLFSEDRSHCQRIPMKTGDYSILGHHEPGTVDHPRGIVWERKSLGDLFGSFGGGRERLEREYERMKGFARKAIGIEANYADVLDPEGADRYWFSKMNPQSVEGSLVAWSHRTGVEVIFCGNRRLGERMAFRWLALWWVEQQKIGNLLTTETDPDTLPL